MDAGAGTGQVGVELQKLGYDNIDALDISHGMLNEAKKKNVYQKFICVSLSEQPTPGIEADEYDALICAGTLIFAHVKPAAIDEIIRMVRNGECPPSPPFVKYIPRWSVPSLIHYSSLVSVRTSWNTENSTFQKRYPKPG